MGPVVIGFILTRKPLVLEFGLHFDTAPFTEYGSLT
jgi:hypothetical protein